MVKNRFVVEVGDTQALKTCIAPPARHRVNAVSGRFGPLRSLESSRCPCRGSAFHRIAS
jgi:hypothetical protein